MKSLMTLAAVLIAGALMATAGSPTSCTNNALNTQLGCSGSGTNQFFTECGKSCTNKLSINTLLSCSGSGTNQFFTECGKSCTNKLSINTQLGCSGSCTNKFFTECGKSCTNKFSISLTAKTLGCTNQVTADKI